MKGLDVPEDLTVRLAEWVELVDAVGADMIFLYKYEVHPFKFTMKYKCRYIMTYKYKVHPNVAKLLKYYSKSGKIGLRPITLPGQ